MKNQNRTYMLEMETPLGKRRGVLNLILLDDSVSGDLTLFTRTAPILKGLRSGDRLTFQGEMRTLVGSLPYQASGTLGEDSLEMEIHTARGHYKVRGTRKRKEGLDIGTGKK